MYAFSSVLEQCQSLQKVNTILENTSRPQWDSTCSLTQTSQVPLAYSGHVPVWIPNQTEVSPFRVYSSWWGGPVSLPIYCVSACCHIRLANSSECFLRRAHFWEPGLFYQSCFWILTLWPIYSNRTLATTCTNWQAAWMPRDGIEISVLLVPGFHATWESGQVGNARTIYGHEPWLHK